MSPKGVVGEMTQNVTKGEGGLKKCHILFEWPPFHRLPLDDGPGLGEAGDEIGFNGNNFFAEQVQNFDAA
jgi:hypothetical protein